MKIRRCRAPWTATGGAADRDAAPPQTNPVSPARLIIICYPTRMTFLPSRTRADDTRHAPSYNDCCQRAVGAPRGDADRECSWSWNANGTRINGSVTACHERIASPFWTQQSMLAPRPAGMNHRNHPVATGAYPPHQGDGYGIQSLD